MEVKADLHVHTAHSTDGREAVKRVVRQAKKAGLAGIAITDHNVITAWSEALEQGAKDGIIVIKGEEVSSSEGHILAYGISERIRKGMSPEETVDAIHEQNGLAVAAHPYRRSNGLGEKVVRKVDFDAIEAMNSRSPEGHNRKAERLSLELKLPATGGSDAHTLEEIGMAYAVFDAVETEDDVIEAIRKGRVKAGGSSQKRTALMGQGLRKLSAWVGRGFNRI